MGAQMPAAATAQERKTDAALAWMSLQLVLNVPAYKRTWQQAVQAMERWRAAQDAADRCKTEDAWPGLSR